MNIGVTGNFLSGKSSLSKILASYLGYFYFDSDKYISDLYKNNEIRKKIIDNFGDNIYIKDNIQKSVLSEIVFNSGKLLRKLESIVHPLVEAEVQRLIKDSLKGNVFEIPLLYEKNFHKYMDLSILVLSDKNECINRAEKRGFTKDDYLKRTVFFMSKKEKLKFNPLIVENNGDFQSLDKKTKIISEMIKNQI